MQVLPFFTCALALMITAWPNETVNAQTTSAVAPDVCKSDTCLGAVSADLDGDKLPDQAALVYHSGTKRYWLSVLTHTGRRLAPFMAYFDPKSDKVSLTVREHRGDPRCRSWVEGRTCGYALVSHDVPARVLYLSDSRNGDFAIYLPQPYGTDFNKDGEMLVVPALDPVAESPPSQ